MFKQAIAAFSLLAVGGAVLAHGAELPSYAVTARIAGPDGGWDLLNVDPATQRLYIARSASVTAVDLATGHVTGELVASTKGHDALPIPGTTRVLSTNGGSNTVTLFDGITGAVIATLPTGTKPDAEAWDPVTRTAWVMTPGSGAITVIDPLAAKVIDTVAVGGSLELGVADGEGRLYANIEDRNEVVVLDTRARKVVSRFPLTGCDGPTGIAYAADARLILSACANGVAVVSRPDGQKVASLKIGRHPDGALYDAQRHVVLVPSGGDGTLAVIRLTPTPELIASLPTAMGAKTAAIDPSTGRVYLPSVQYAPAQPGTRPAAIPGSFTVLVVSPTGAAQ
jgi:YVTN family beta-propeller protein